MQDKKQHHSKGEESKHYLDLSIEATELENNICKS